MNTGYRGEGCYSCSFSVSFKLHQNKMFKILCAQVPNSEYVKGYIVKRCHYPIALLEWRTFPFQRQLPHTGFPGGSGVKNPPANAGDVGLIPGSGRSPREENGNPLRCSCLGNPMDRGAWWASVHGVTRVRHDIATKTTTETTNCCMQLACIFTCYQQIARIFFFQFYTSDRIITTVLHIVFFTHQSILIYEYIWTVLFFFQWLHNNPLNVHLYIYLTSLF